MNALATSLLAALLMLGGAGAGVLLRRSLPHHHLNEHSKDVVRLGTALLATVTALVLGLLITSAKSTYETQRSQVKIIATKLVLLDELLKRYGPETHQARDLQRQAMLPLVDRIWGQHAVRTATGAPFEPSREGERVYEAVESLAHGTRSSATSSSGLWRPSRRSPRRASCCSRSRRQGCRRPCC